MDVICYLNEQNEANNNKHNKSVVVAKVQLKRRLDGGQASFTNNIQVNLVLDFLLLSVFPPSSVPAFSPVSIRKLKGRTNTYYI